jgi:hypothetical protein
MAIEALAVHNHDYYSALESIWQNNVGNPQPYRDVKAILDAVETQLFDNYQIMDIGGVKYPVARVSTRQVATQLYGAGTREQILASNPQAPDRVYTAFMFFSPPPGGEAAFLNFHAHDFVSQNLPRIVNEKQSERVLADAVVYLLGHTTALSAEVTSRFIAKTLRLGFGAYGEAYAQGLRRLIAADQLNPSQIILRGGSLGAIYARESAAKLPEYQDKIVLLVFKNHHFFGGEELED